MRGSWRWAASSLFRESVHGSAVRVVRCGAGENFEFGAFWDLKIIVTVYVTMKLYERV